MASQPPIVRQFAWFSFVPHLLVLGFLVGVAWLVGLEDYPVIGAGVYLAYSLGIRFFILRAHRAGMALVRRGKFWEAIPHFQGSYEFFTRHSLIDKLRFLSLLSSSRVSYREMALLNLAFCHAQNGNGEKAREYYLQTVREYPGSRIAAAGLRMHEAGERANASAAQPE